MVNINKDVVKNLREALENNNVFSTYPNAMNNFPCCVYTIEENNVYLTDRKNNELYSSLSFKIDVWFKVGDKNINNTIDKINSKFMGDGWKRTFCNEVADIDELRHYVLRFSGVVATDNNNKIYN